MSIPVFLSCDNKFAPFLSVCIVSILKNTSSFVEFYILDGGIESNNKQKICNVKNKFDNCSIEFIDVNLEKYFSNLPKSKYISRAMYSRFLIPLLKPNLKKVLYSDVDVVFVKDIKELYDLDLNGHIIGAVPEYRFTELKDKYEDRKQRLNLKDNDSLFLSGLLIIDIDKWNAENTTQNLLDLAQQLANDNKLRLPDLDTLNKYFQSNFERLDKKFCVIPKALRQNFNKSEIAHIKNNVVIYHYAGGGKFKPWNNKKAASAKYFWKYVRYTMFKKDINKIYKIFNNENNFFENIFSVKNSEVDKIMYRVITIFGIKIKFKKSNEQIVRTNYKRVIKRLQKKYKSNKKINVLFLSNEISKWGYETLYHKFANSEHYLPTIVVAPLPRVLDDSDKTQPTLEYQYDFYKKNGLNVKFGYKNNKYINIEHFKPDIIFYQQLGGIPKSAYPIITSKYALTFYSSYAFDVIDSMHHYKQHFHKLLYSYFCTSTYDLLRFEKYKKGNSKNCVVTGYPKLDAYVDKEELDYNKYWKNPDKFKIIYAPHHSFEEDGVNLATFKENGRLMLELAKSHPETTWVFKPHPRFQFALLENNIMTQDEITKYYEEWKEVGTICINGNYIDLFRTSDLMITDCGSFLGEYLPSKKPLIQLINPKAKFNELGKNVKNEYYFSNNNEELISLFNEIVVNKNDYKKINRENLADKMFDFSQTASNKIFNYIENLLLNFGKFKCKK